MVDQKDIVGCIPEDKLNYTDILIYTIIVIYKQELQLNRPYGEQIYIVKWIFVEI